MLKLIGYLIYLYFLCILSLFWTSFVLIRAFIEILRNPKRFFYLKDRPNPPKVLYQNPEFRHNFLNIRNGQIKIHYVEAGDLNRPLILCLHGFPEFWYSWRHQLNEFKHNFHIVAIDMRGYGESSKPRSIGAYSLENLVEDIREVISALGRDRCVLMAHDWGGMIAWQFALLYPEYIEKLIVLNCPHPEAFQNRLMISLNQWLKSWYMFFFQFPIVPEILFRSNDMKLLNDMFTKLPSGCVNPDAFTQEDLEAWKYMFQQPYAWTAAFNYYRSALRRQPWRWIAEPKDKKLHKLDTKLIRPSTLIIWGSNDAALETELAHGSLQFCQKGMLRIIENASHWVQQDRPELCNQFIHDFLKD